MRVCTIDDCGRKHYARGWCFKHYQRWYRRGDPLTVLPGGGGFHAPHVIQHGTVNEYNNYGCRCDACREVAVAYQLRQRAGVCPSCGGRVSNRYVSELCLSCYNRLREAPHGTVARYKRCRCDLCREASNKARRDYRHAHPESRDRENRKRLERYYASKQSEGAAPK